jgi:hypothetical protein
LHPCRVYSCLGFVVEKVFAAPLMLYLRFTLRVLQLSASLDAVLLDQLCAGAACLRAYLRLAVTNVAAAGVDDRDISSLPCSCHSIVQSDRCRPRLPPRWAAHAIDAIASTACIGDTTPPRAAMLSRASIMECFSIFDRPFTVQMQEDSHASSTTSSFSLVGVHPHVLHDEAAGAILLNSRVVSHFPLVIPNRQLLHGGVLQLKIW